MPASMDVELRSHLFQDGLEQGAFLFAEVQESPDRLRLEARDRYLVPPEGWEVQREDLLVMKDSERAKIMKIARDLGYAAVDCHSHPFSLDGVFFSPSDRKGATEFADYVSWKLSRKPFVTSVWGEASFDAVVWHKDFSTARRVDEIQILGDRARILVPRGTWFSRPEPGCGGVDRGRS